MLMLDRTEHHREVPHLITTELARRRLTRVHRFVVILFTATDYSLLNINCPTHDSCPQWARTGWHAAQIGLVSFTSCPLCCSTYLPSLEPSLFHSVILSSVVRQVAVIDTGFWPVLKALFFFAHNEHHSEAARSVLRGMTLCLVAAASLACLGLASNHEEVSLRLEAVILLHVTCDNLHLPPSANLFTLLSSLGVELSASRVPHDVSSSACDRMLQINVALGVSHGVRGPAHKHGHLTLQ